MGKKHRIIRQLNKITKDQLPKGTLDTFRYFNLGVMTIYIGRRYDGSLFMGGTLKSDKMNGIIRGWVSKPGKGLGISD